MHTTRTRSRRRASTGLALALSAWAATPGCYLGWKIERQEDPPRQVIEQRVVSRRVTQLDLPAPLRLVVEEQLEETRRETTPWHDPSLSFEFDGLLFALGVLYLIFDQDGGVPYTFYGALLILVSPVVDIPALIGSLLFSPPAGAIDLATTPESGQEELTVVARPIVPVRETDVRLRAGAVTWDGHTDTSGVLYLPPEVSAALVPQGSQDTVWRGELTWRSGDQDVVVRFTLPADTVRRVQAGR